MNFLKPRVLCLALIFVTTGCGGTAASETSRATREDTPSAASATSSGAAATTASTRPAPIIYRPDSLSYAQKVPLVIALHGSGMSPAGMRYITGMNTVANEHGFVVAYLASSDAAAAWKPASDTTYVHDMISQLTRTENIDPNRVYVIGFSAGGYEAWRMGCVYSSQVAGIAIVGNNMNQELYNSCRLSRPVTEYLLVGGADSVRPTGIPGRLPGAPKTTAHWRQLDGCTNRTTGPLISGNITLQLWSPCVDGSAVQLTYVGGGLHNWPGGPTISVAADPYSKRYDASQAIWTFLSPHALSPHTAAGSLLSVKATAGKRRTIEAALALGESVAASATLSGRGHTWKLKTAHLGAGARLLPISVPTSVRSGRYSIKLKLVDSYGRGLTLSKSVQLAKR